MTHRTLSSLLRTAIPATCIALAACSDGSRSPAHDAGLQLHAVIVITYDAGSSPDAATSSDASAPPAGDASADARPDVPSLPADAGTPVDSITADDPATLAHVRDVLARGAARGNRREVVAKIGDSISESASFLQDCGMGYYTLGEHPELEATIGYFTMVPLPDNRNSLSRASISARGGWALSDALDGGPDGCALAQELDAIHPAWALMMYGTNDLDRYDLGTYAANLATAIDLIEARGVVPILSTIPPRLDAPDRGARVGPINDVVRAVAVTRHLPWVDYWHALQAAPGYGISMDGIHPNAFHDDMGTRACVFTADALAFGYNLRNLTALQVLDRVRGY